MNCYLHEPCFVDWESIHKARTEALKSGLTAYGKEATFWMRNDVAEHISEDELDQPEPTEVTGMATAIQKIHYLRTRKEYEEADKLKTKYNILVVDGGYIACNNKW